MSPLSIILGINERGQIAVTNEGFYADDLKLFFSSSNFHDSLTHVCIMNV